MNSETIRCKREKASYPEHFADDLCAFQEFCADVSLFVAHNAAFHRRFIPSLRTNSGLRFFDTMAENTHIIRLEAEGFTGWKYPTLEEAAEYYGVAIEERKPRSGIYEVGITKDIFMAMLGRSTLRLVKLD